MPPQSPYTAGRLSLRPAAEKKEKINCTGTGGHGTGTLGTAETLWAQHSDSGDSEDIGNTMGQWEHSTGTLGTQQGRGMGTVRTRWGTLGTQLGDTKDMAWVDIAQGHLGTLDLGTASGDLRDNKGTQRFRGAQQALGVNPAHLGAPSRIWGESGLFWDTRQDLG